MTKVKISARMLKVLNERRATVRNVSGRKRKRSGHREEGSWKRNGKEETQSRRKENKNSSKKVLTNSKGFGNIPKALDERNQRRELRDDFVFQGSRQERKLSEAAEKNKKS